MSQHVNNQHTVPRFLLKHFSEDNLNVWTFDKQYKQIKKRSIDSLTVEKNIYDRVPGEKKGSYEYNFQRAEDAAAPLISKIIELGSIAHISMDDKVTLSVFIAMQFRRTKNAMIEIDEFDKSFREGIRDFIKDAGIEMDVPNSEPKKIWLDGFNDSPIFAEHIYNKTWVIIKSENKFYSSDNPIVLSNTHNKNNERGTLGLKSKGIEIYFPLSPSLILAMLCKQTYGPPEIGYIFENDTSYYNSLQTIYAYRFVFAGNNEFELAKDMIKKGDAKFIP